jgi:hypothetical protein
LKFGSAVFLSARCLRFAKRFSTLCSPQASVCLEARGRRSSYAGGSASDQGDLVAEFARAIHLCGASAGAGAEVRVCLPNIHCHRTLLRQAIEYLLGMLLIDLTSLGQSLVCPS